MKNLVNTLIVLSAFLFLIHLSKTLKKHPKKHKKRHTTEVSSQERKREVEPIVEKETEKIIIKGLGDVDQDDKLYASSVIKDFYGYECIIGDNIDIPSSMYLTGSVIDAEKSIYQFDDNVKTIYLTPNGLREGDLELRGYTTMYGKSILVRSVRGFMKETILHEIGHTLGLDHCDNKSCIMAVNNDEYETGKFCKSCKKVINKNN